jgi:hypothetical protein
MPDLFSDTGNLAFIMFYISLLTPIRSFMLIAGRNSGIYLALKCIG